MTDTKTRTETVQSYNESFSQPLWEFIAELQELMEGIPSDLRDGAYINFDKYGPDMDSAYGTLEVCYDRPWTAEEIAQEQRWKEESALRDEAAQRAEYARLKAKFGDNS